MRRTGFIRLYKTGFANYPANYTAMDVGSKLSGKSAFCSISMLISPTQSENRSTISQSSFLGIAQKHIAALEEQSLNKELYFNNAKDFQGNSYPDFLRSNNEMFSMGKYININFFSFFFFNIS